MTPNVAVGQQSARDQSRHHTYHSSHDLASNQAPGINVHHATPRGAHYANPSTGAPLPGVLQPGRPGASASITAPSTIPTLPKLQNANQQQLASSRPATANHAHNYSRSSPAGMDQSKYAPFVSTPEGNKYASPPNNRYASSQIAQNDSMYSPLGLADIRPLTESGILDGSQSANPYSNDGFPTFPTNSNYLAPWAVYAFDWCKWPVQQQGLGDSGGKMAIGSYVEDGHNFVGADLTRGSTGSNLSLDPDTRYSHVIRT